VLCTDYVLGVVLFTDCVCVVCGVVLFTDCMRCCDFYILCGGLCCVLIVWDVV
jgi:hypothetical protein